MRKSKSVAKRMRQSERKRLRGKAVKSHIKTLTRKLKASQTREESGLLLRRVVSSYDKAVQKGIMHHRTAARKKSALARQVPSEVQTKPKKRRSKASSHSES